MPSPPAREKPPTKTNTKPARKPDPFAELVEAVAEVVADRVVEKLAAKAKTPPMPEMVPVWLSRPREPGKRRRVKGPGDWTPEKAMRAIGMVKMGEPGYDEALREYLVRKRAHEAEIAARAQLRRAARLLRKLVTTATNRS